MKEKTITIKTNEISQRQYSTLLLELNIIKQQWRSYDSVAQAAAEKQFDDDVMDKAASKKAKKEKIGKQASKLSQADEDRYERIKNGLEKLKKKGDEESIKRMKAILGKKDVQKLIKAKGREESSFM